MREVEPRSIDRSLAVDLEQDVFLLVREVRVPQSHGVALIEQRWVDEERLPYVCRCLAIDAVMRDQAFRDRVARIFHIEHLKYGRGSR